MKGVASFLFLVLCGALLGAEASHYRYGNVNWEPNNPNNLAERSVKFFVKQAWRLSFFTRSCRCRNSGGSCDNSCPIGGTLSSVGSMSWGDGSSSSISNLGITNRCVGGGGACDWFTLSRTLTHTYSAQNRGGGAPWQVTWGSCCRIGGMQNNAHGSYRFFSDINLSPVGSWVNTSPVASQVPIQEIQTGRNNVWSLGASDNDVDPLSFSIGSGADMGSGCSGAPGGFAVNSQTGAVSFNPPTSSENVLYSAMVIVGDGYSRITVDFIMITIKPKNICKSCSPGTPTRCNICTSNGQCSGGCQCQINADPTFYNVPGSPFLAPTLGTTVCCLVGQACSFLIGVEDTVDTTCDTVSVVSGDVPIGATPPVLHRNVAGTWRREYSFTWTPSAAQARTHRVSFVAHDLFNGRGGPQSIELFVPTVSQSVQPTISGYSPQTADENTASILTVDGSNFNRGLGLYCRFQLGGNPFFLVRAVYVSTSRILCSMPNKASLGGGSNNNVKVWVSNIASCNQWTPVTPDFAFFPACPPGTAGPTCSQCPAGKYQTVGGVGTGTQCVNCPAGRYGNAPGLTIPTCTGPCIAGHYCPPGSTAPTANDCPAGYYGDRPELQDAGCSGLCQAGYFCGAGSVSARQGTCPPGRYGGPGEVNSVCAGPCNAGYFCTGASTTATQNECGGADVYCQEGSGSPLTAPAGTYTTGGAGPTTRTGIQTCEPGYYCDGGVRSDCPPGRYQADPAGSSAGCQGPCRCGFKCPARSTSDSAVPCGAGLALPATVYCPPGTSIPQTFDTDDFYSTPEDAPPDQRCGFAACTGDEFCVDGYRRPRVEWTETCSGSALVVQNNYTVSENSNVNSFDVSLRSNENSGTVSITDVTFTAPPGCPNASAWSYSASQSGNSATATLSATGYSPNHEVCDHFNAVIDARTGLGVDFTCELEILVEDLNDCPVWDTGAMTADDSRYPVRLLENPKLGTGLAMQLAAEGIVTDEDEGSELDFSIVTVTPSDVTPGAPSGLFAIGRCSGQLWINTTIPGDVDWELGQREWTIRVQVNDTAQENPCAIQEDMQVRVVNINEAPYFSAAGSTFTVPENSPLGTLTSPSNPSVVDPDATFNPPSPPDTLPDPLWYKTSFDIVAQSDALFSINVTSGDISVGVTSLNFEALGTPSVTATLAVRDSGSPPLNSQDDFTLQVQDINDPPRVPATQLFVPELSVPGTVVGQVTAADDEYMFNASSTTISWTVQVEQFGVCPAGSPQSFSNPFIIVPTTNPSFDPRVTADIIVNGTLDFESLALYTLRVQATDNGHLGFPPESGVGFVTVNITNVNEPPMYDGPTTLYTDEERITPAQISAWGLALNASDPDVGPGLGCALGPRQQDPLSFSFVSGSDDHIGINLATGVVSAVARLNYESKNVYTIVTRLADPSTFITFTLTVNVLNVNEPPTMPSGQVVYMDEDVGPGVFASATAALLTPGLLVADDPDFDDNTTTLHYAMQADGAGSDKMHVQVRSLVTNPGTVSAWQHATFNFEATPTLGMDITVTDRHGATVNGSVTLMLQNIPEPPFLSDSFVGLAELSPSGTSVLSLTVEDDDFGDSVTYNISSVSSNGSISCATLFPPGTDIVGDTLVTADTAPAKLVAVQECYVTIIAKDSTNLTDAAVITVRLTPQNLAPTIDPIQSFTVPESAIVGTIIVGNLTGKDANVLQSLSYVLVSAVDKNGANALSKFAVAGPTLCAPPPGQQCPGKLQLLSKLDFETMDEYTLEVQVADDDVPSANARSTITLTVQDVNEAPVQTSAGTIFLIPEDTTDGGVPNPAPTYAVATDDDGNTLTWSSTSLPSILSGVVTVQDGGPSGAHGLITVSNPDPAVISAALNFEANTQPLGFNLTVTDDGAGSLSRQAFYGIQLVDVNEPPSATWSPAALTVVEGQDRIGDVLASVFGTDPDIWSTNGWRVLTYSIQSGNTDSTFEATTNAQAQMGEIRVQHIVDYEKATSFSLGVRVTDGGGLFYDFTLPVTVVNVNDVSISNVTGPWTTMNTQGGEILNLWGTNLGHYHDMSAATITLRADATISRGDQQTFLRRNVFPCTQITTNTHIQCTTQAGVGSDLRWKLYVEHPDGAIDIAPVTVNNGQQLLGSYGVPVITGISGAHVGMNTEGGNSVSFTGINFPPASLSNTSGFAYWRVTYGQAGASYTASNDASTPTSASVTSGPGVGSGLGWVINVGGLQSVPFFAPGTASSYAAPTITSVRLAVQGVDISGLPGAVDRTIMNGAGMETVVIKGTNLGTESTRAVDAGFKVVYARLLNSVTINGTTSVLPSQYRGGRGSGIAAGPLVVPAQYAVNWERLYTYTATGCSVIIPHEELHCTSAVGAGDGLVWRVTVGGQESAIVAGSSVSLHYHPPIISNLGGENAFNSPTQGGGAIDIQGLHLGAPGDLRVLATYGRQHEVTRFQAVACTTESDKSIRCYTAPGTGSQFYWTLAVAGQASLSNDFPAMTSYGLPVVSEYTGPGAKDANTTGGQVVILKGRNFGPIGPQNIDMARYYNGRSMVKFREAEAAGSTSDFAPPVFVVTSDCNVTVAHTQVQCTLAPGAGEGLKWDLVIDGLLSSELSTAYRPPSIISQSGEGASPANSAGGEIVHLDGADFGPPLSYLQSVLGVQTPYLEWVRYTPYTTLSVGYYEAQDCAVVNHTRITCRTLPGSGLNMHWFARVRGQTSLPSVATWSYDSPTIDALEAGVRFVGQGAAAQLIVLPRGQWGTPPRMWTNDDGELIRIVGRGFGVRDPQTNLTVVAGGRDLPVLESWYDAQREKEVILFRKPAGWGSSQTLHVRISNLEPVPRMSTSVPFDYKPPVRTAQPRDEFADLSTTLMNITILGSGFCTPLTGPGPTVGAGDPVPPPTPFSVNGPQDNCGQIFLKDVNYDVPNPNQIDQLYPNWVTMQGASRVFPVPRERFFSWNDTYIKFWLYSAEGSADIQVGNQAFSIGFSDIQIAARDGVCEATTQRYRLQTAGTDILRFPVDNVCNRNDVEVEFSRVGGSSTQPCVLVSNVTQSVGQADGDGPFGTTSSTTNGPDACVVECRVPPGDGNADRNVFIVKTSSATTDPCKIGYAAPNVTSATMALDTNGRPAASRVVSARMSDEPVPDGNIFLDYGGGESVTLPSFRTILTVPTTGGPLVLQGHNLGLQGPAADSSCLDSWVALWRYGAVPSDGAVCAGTDSVAERTPHSHFAATIPMPPGVGRRQYLAIGVSGQAMRDTFVAVQYERPVVTSVTPSSVPSQGGWVTVDGANFGNREQDITVWVGGVGERQCSNVVFTSLHHTFMCFVPELLPGFATASGVSLIVEVAEQLSCQAGDPAARCAPSVQYDAPVITSLSTWQVPTNGGTRVVVEGSNFGRNTFLPPSNPGADLNTAGLTDAEVLAVLRLRPTRPSDLTYLVPDPFSNSQLADKGGRIVYHNHTRIEFITPTGQGGPRELTIFVGQNSYTVPVATNALRFDPPAFNIAKPPSGPTKGFIVALEGTSLGSREYRSSTSALVPTYTLGSIATRADLLDKPAGQNGIEVTLNIDGYADPQPCLDMQPYWNTDRVNLQWARAYLHYEFLFDTMPTPANRPLSPYTHNTYYCFVPTGLGSDVEVVANVDGIEMVQPFSLDYNPPYISTTQANPADAFGQDDFKIKGSDFGPLDPEVNPISVYIGEDECLGASQILDGTIQCAMQGGTVGPKGILLTAASFVNISYPALAAGSLGSRVLTDVLEGRVAAVGSSGDALHVRDVVRRLSDLPDPRARVRILPAGEGRVSIDMVAVDRASGLPVMTPLDQLPTLPLKTAGRALQSNASDAGDAQIPPSYTLNDYPVNRLDGVFKIQFHCQIGSYGQVSEECFPCPDGGECQPMCLASTAAGICVDFQEPYSQPGWYGMPVAVGDPECDRQSRPAPYNETVCLNFLPCEPAEACIGNNECRPEYEGLRCGQCSQGHYRVAGLCVKCPDLAGLFIALFVIMIISMALIGYILNRKKMHLAFISIGVDYFQVLAMFATARVAWPQFLRDLYRILSIFQINLDITAPECAIPDVKYSGKWFVIESLPLFLGLLLLLIHGAKTLLNIILKVDRKHRNKHTPTLVAMATLLMYYLYLLLTRTTFDAFNCQPTDPSDGKLYLEVEFIECYQPTHNEVFYPALFFTLPVYTIAYPVWVYFHLKKNKDKVKTDQILRAMGIGDSELTNPNYAFRQMFHKLYYHFKPGKWYWLLLILLRKFLIALTGLMFRRTPSFQMALAFLVLFFSFSLQVRHNPYMSMAERRGIILHHQSKVKEGNKKHQAIKAAYETAVRHSNARQRRRQVNMDAVSSSKGPSSQDYLFDYNTMEAVLLSCGCFVCLSGIMFQTGDPNSDIYLAQRDALTVLVGIVIFVSMVYFFTVFGFEVYTTCGGANCSNLWASDGEGGRGRSGTKSGKKPKLKKGGAGASRRDLALAAELDAQMAEGGAMEVNPLAMRQTMEADLAALNDVLGSEGMPTQQQWNMVRAHANTLNKDVTDLRWEVSKLEEERDAVAEKRRETVGRNGKRRSILERALGLNKQSPGATPDVAAVIAARSGSGSLSASDEAAGHGIQMTPLSAGGAAAASVVPSKHSKQKRPSLATTVPSAVQATDGDWTRCHNEDGEVWYVNNETGESTYDMPQGFAAPDSMLWTPDMAAVQAATLDHIKEEEGDGEGGDDDSDEPAAPEGKAAANPIHDRASRMRRMSMSTK